MKVYIINKINYEYDDNWYSKSGENIVKAYKNRKMAIKDRAELEIKELKGVFRTSKLGGVERCFSYGYTRHVDLEDPTLVKKIEKLGFHINEYDNAIAPDRSKTRSDNDWLDLGGLVDLMFYKVDEMEVEDE